MVAPKGNKNGLKLKSPDIRQLAYKEYCAHIAQGLSKECFTFKHEGLTCTFRTLERYIAENPVEFPPIHKEIAECESLKSWEMTAHDMAKGKIRNCQPAVLQMIMRNKFGWDRDDAEEVAECAADIILKMIKEA